VLPVARRGEAKLQLAVAGHARGGKKERSVQLATVDGEQIDLGFGVRRSDVAPGRNPRGAQVRHHHVSVLAEPAPLNLNPP
jgi:hypothetical protein